MKAFGEDSRQILISTWKNSALLPGKYSSTQSTAGQHGFPVGFCEERPTPLEPHLLVPTTPLPDSFRVADNSEAVWLPIWSKITTEGTSARCFVSLIRAVEPAWDRHGSRVAQGNSKRAARFRRAAGSFRRTSANRWRLH